MSKEISKQTPPMARALCYRLVRGFGYSALFLGFASLIVNEFIGDKRHGLMLVGAASYCVAASLFSGTLVNVCDGIWCSQNNRRRATALCFAWAILLLFLAAICGVGIYHRHPFS